MFRRVQLSWSRGVYALKVIDTPVWAAAVASAYESVMVRVGHPCCGEGICARLPDLLGDPIVRLASFGLKATGRAVSDRDRVALRILISAEAAERLLAFGVDLADENDEATEDEEEPHP